MVYNGVELVFKCQMLIF